MEKPIEYSSRIDIESYKNLRFVLTALDRREKDIVISADYGPSHDEPGMIVADVWAGFADGSLCSATRFLRNRDKKNEKNEGKYLK